MILHLAHLQHYCKCHLQKVHLTIEQPTEMVMFAITLNTIPTNLESSQSVSISPGVFFSFLMLLAYY